jgi:hypothetical protein
MINYTDLPNPDDRLNAILDKIAKLGIKKLDKEELVFLESYSIGKESEINQMLIEEERMKTFISDDGKFIFKLDKIENDEENQAKYINGKLIVPDIIINKKLIKGELQGCIIVFIGGSVALDFRNNKYDVFEFVYGLEYELDCFVDDIISKLHNNYKS